MGIPVAAVEASALHRQFQSQVAILGWGYLTVVNERKLSPLFQSQVAILGWGY